MKKILVVDDSDFARKLAYESLRKYYDVRCSSCGLEGIQEAKKYQPDLIVLDVIMPGIDGIETCRQIKSEQSIKDIPIIIVTSCHDKIIEQACLDAGARDFITKPYDCRIVLKRIDNAIKYNVECV